MFWIKRWRLRIRQWDKPMNARTHRHLTYGLLLLFLLGCAPAISATPTSAPRLLLTNNLVPHRSHFQLKLPQSLRQ